jgi:hypothetical protein
MFRVDIEYYTYLEPIITISRRAFTWRGAIRKAFNNINFVNSLSCGTVHYMQVWFRGQKIYGEGNKVLYKGKVK